MQIPCYIRHMASSGVSSCTCTCSCRTDEQLKLGEQVQDVRQPQLQRWHSHCRLPEVLLTGLRANPPGLLLSQPTLCLLPARVLSQSRLWASNEDNPVCRARLDGYSQLRQVGQGVVKANPFAEPPAGLRKSGDLTSSSDGSASYRERLARLRRPE